MDLPVEPSTAAKTDAKKGAGLLPAEAGYLIGGPYPRYIEDSAAYKTGVTYPPLLQDNSDPAADELLSIWDEIDKARAPMLQDAASLDVKDSGMYTELGKLTAETDAVNAEREKWIAAVQNFNAKCANGQPVSYSWCQNEQKRVLAWQKDLEARIEVHNQKAKDFDKRAAELEGVAKGWGATVAEWEKKINSFIDKAKGVLANTGTCTKDEKEQLDAQVKAACKPGPEKCLQDDDCSVLGEKNNGFLRCYNARKKINDKCFAGGDPGHYTAMTYASNAIMNCQQFLNDKECLNSGKCKRKELGDLLASARNACRKTEKKCTADMECL